jgi:hypothetical protein
MQDLALGLAGLITGTIVGMKTFKPENYEN